MFLRLALFVLLLMPLPAAAQDVAGNWTFGIGPVGILQFRVEREDDDRWHGIWLRPKSFASNGVVFLDIQGPPIDVPASQVREINGWLELTFEDPRPGAVPDIFLLRALPDGTAEAVYADTGFPPFKLVRDNTMRGIGPWDSELAYLRAGFDAEAAGTPIQFSSGTSAIAARLAEVIAARQAQEAQMPSEDDLVAEPSEPVQSPPLPEPQIETTPKVPASPPMMEGR